MKDNHLPTPQKERLLGNSGMKSIAEHARTPRKFNRKGLDSAFASVSEDVMLQTPNGSIDVASISEVSDDNQFCESAESSIQNPTISPTSEATDLNLLSSMITSDKEGDITFSRSASAESDGARRSSVEAELVVKHLRQARTQADGDLRFKKLLDALITVVIEEFYGFPEERDFLRDLESWKISIMFLSLMLWILALAAVGVSTWGVQSSFIEPPPT